MANNQFEFSLTFQEIPVKLTKEDGTILNCVLREMSGFHRDIYLNQESPKINKATKQLSDYKDVQANLLAKVLIDTSSGEPVPIAVIRDFPAKVQNELYQMASKLNGFDDQAKEEAKND